MGGSGDCWSIGNVGCCTQRISDTLWRRGRVDLRSRDTIKQIPKPSHRRLNYSTGGLSERSNTDSDSDSESEVESEFYDGQVQKKRKADDSQRNRQSESPSIGIMKRQT